MLYYILYIDSIEANVDNAAVHVEDANVQLQKASHYQVLQSYHKFVVLIGCSHVFKNKLMLLNSIVGVFSLMRPAGFHI